MSESGDDFKRPKEYLPRESLPKPPRQQLMDQLGLQDEDCNSKTSSSESEDEAPSHSLHTPVTPSRPKSSNEVEELKIILRETQRKLFLANSNLTDSTNSKEKKLKIMKSSHNTAMALKEQLIQDLQDIIEEKEEVITQLRGSNPPSTLPEDESTRKLVNRIAQLHKENISLHTRCEDVCEEVKLLKVEKVRLEDELVMAKDVPVKIPLSANSQTTRQIKELTQKIKSLELEKGAIHSSSQTENDLQVKVVTLEAQLAASQAEIGDLRIKNKVNVERITQVEAQNSTLQREVQRLTSEITMYKSNEKQLLARLEFVDKSLKEKSSYASDLNSEKERLQLEINTTRSKMVTLEDAHRGVLEVVKNTEAREKEAIAECEALREQVTSLQVQLKHERSNLAIQYSKSSELQKRAEESLSRCVHLESQITESSQRCQQLERQLKEAETKMAQAVSTAMEEGRARTAGTNEKLVTVRAHLARVHLSALNVAQSITDIKKLAQTSYEAFNKDICTACQKICQQISGIATSHHQLVSKYRKEMLLRKKLHNELVDLKGNIRVFCRVRPVISEDGEGTQADVVVQPDKDDDGVVKVFTKGTWKVFELDKVFGTKSTQTEVFSEVKDLVVSCMDGYNVCIFAYGQTGSGKTFTMEGTADNPGINQRALLELFRITEERQDDWEYTVVVSVLEIYNEMVRDLLSLQHTEKMEIKQGPEGNYVPGLTHVQVTCLRELNEVFAIGHENRATGSTKMNIQSSRSHALLCVTVHGKCNTTGTKVIGKLNLIDLAGSERVDKSGSDGIRLQEAKHINKSLSALGDVIHSLKSKCQHIPYRNSKLTYLLQDSLSGDSKTLMVVQVSPVEKNGMETVCSFNFAQRVRAVELGQAARKVIEAHS